MPKTRMPAEWAEHDACWLAFPHLDEEWSGHLREAQDDIAAFARALARSGEAVLVLVRDEAVKALAREAIGDVPGVELLVRPYGDCWVRDTGAIFVLEGAGAGEAETLAARSFAFDGWGGKYDMPGDTEVSMRMAQDAAVTPARSDFVLEGGGVETDGEGTFLVTQCVVDRNPGETRESMAEKLRDALGAERCLYVEGVLENDHTDGHIDTIARFVAPGRVVCMASDASHPGGDPNAAAMRTVAESLRGQRDARGRPLEVVEIPSPGAVVIDDFLTPASYCNFYIANRAVLVPAYGVPADARARDALAPLFPGRRVELVPARGLITGGGALHCASQQQPSRPG